MDDLRALTAIRNTTTVATFAHRFHTPVDLVVEEATRLVDAGAIRVVGGGSVEVGRRLALTRAGELRTGRTL